MHTRRERVQWWLQRVRNRPLKRNIGALKDFLRGRWLSIKHWRFRCPECGARTRVFEPGRGTRECTECPAITLPTEEQPEGRTWPWSGLPDRWVTMEVPTEEERFADERGSQSLLGRFLPWRGPS